MRIGFNSLSAGASVNHLHWQFWRPPLPPNGRLPIEVAARRPLPEPAQGAAAEGSPRWEQVIGYHLRALALAGALLPNNRPVAAELIANCSQGLLGMGVAHNMLYSRLEGVVYVVPRRSVSNYTWFRGLTSPGFPEAAGEMVLSHTELGENLTAEELNHHFRTYLSLSEDEFEKAVIACTSNHSAALEHKNSTSSAKARPPKSKKRVVRPPVLSEQSANETAVVEESSPVKPQQSSPQNTSHPVGK